MSFVKLNYIILNYSIFTRMKNKTIHRCKEIRESGIRGQTLISHRTNLFKGVNFQNYYKFHKRHFRSTVPNRALPPIVWGVIRFVLKIFAIFSGRRLRLWWSKLPPSEKQRIIYKIRENRSKLWLGSFTFGGLVSFYYVSHLVEDPITKRRKFILFSEKQIISIANMQCEVLLKKFGNKISKSGNDYEKVYNISQRILKSNKHFPDVRQKWEVFVIDDSSVKNAFVLPSGHIFIFTGMLKIASNDDQLAVVIAHEMAHTFLNHAAEVVSRAHFIELLMLLPVFLVWALLPDFIALSSQLLMEVLSILLFRFPMNRLMEIEADTVGLAMAARACYDPRQALEFWRKLGELEDLQVIEWLSTHPEYKTRLEILNRRMAEAVKIRDRHCSH